MLMMMKDNEQDTVFIIYSVNMITILMGDPDDEDTEAFGRR